MTASERKPAVEGAVVVQGRLVALRHKRIEDADDDYRWRVDPELAELDATVAMRLSLDDFRSRIAQELRYPTAWVKRFAIDTLDGVHVGNCMAYDLDTVTGEGEVGIMIGERAYWGQGYGTEALALLVDECFAMNSIRRLYLHTLEWNERARRAFAKIGFREVRSVRRAGKDFVRMELQRKDWPAKRAVLLHAPPAPDASPQDG
ncbi:MAG: GNAT family N-acetyltransferase [Dehalococcoidia bacterium]|nr:GNAT family N-acetyltransferase [Dehalococcoidia bacterium]